MLTSFTRLQETFEVLSDYADPCHRHHVLSESRLTVLSCRRSSVNSPLSETDAVTDSDRAALSL